MGLRWLGFTPLLTCYFSRGTFQYTSLTNFSHESRTTPVWNVGLQFGATGSFLSRILASLGVRSAFLWLHVMQAKTQFSHVLSPPRERGMMWSIVRLDIPGCVPQYWQVHLSLRNRFFLLNASRETGTLS